MPQKLFINWDRVPGRRLRCVSPSYLYYLLIRLKKFLGFSLGRTLFNSTWADKNIEVPEEAISDRLREHASVEVGHLEESFLKLHCYHFPSQPPYQAYHGMAFISQDRLVGLLVSWVPEVPDRFFYSCTSQDANGDKWIATFGSPLPLSVPPNCESAVAPRPRLDAIVQYHRERIAQQSVVPMLIENITSIVVQLSVELIDHNLDEGLLELWDAE